MKNKTLTLAIILVIDKCFIRILSSSVTLF